MVDAQKTPGFLQGGGELGELIRTYDWSGTNLGDPAQWPRGLQATIGILLHTSFPMFLFWGDDLTCFYNDAFRPSLGTEGKHPAVGKTGKAVWPEIWDFIGPLIEKVMTTGEPVWFQDQLVPFYRNGRTEDIYWTFSYSPAYGDDGTISGVLVVCNETTQQVNNYRQLRESRDALEFAIKATELGTWDIDPVLNTIKGNDRLKDIFGIPHKSDITFDAILDTMPDTDRLRAEQAIEHALQYSSGGIYDIEHTSYHPVTKKERTISAKGKVWFNEDQVAIRFNGTLQDVTLQAQSRKIIEESEERFRTMAEGTDMLIAVADEHSNATYFNSAWTRFTGRPLESLLNRGWADLIHPDDRNAFVSVYLKALEEKAAFVGEFRIMNSEGAYRWLLASGPARYLPDGSFAGHISSAIDITDRKQTETALRESEQRFRNLIAESVVAIALFTGPDMIIELANHAIIDLWGKGNDVVGKPLLDVIPEIKDQPYLQILKDVLRTGKIYSQEAARVELLRNGKKEIVYRDFSYKPIADELGNIANILVMVVDVTPRVVAQARLVESEQQVRSIVESAPFPIGVYIGKEMRIALANQSILNVWGKGSDVIGKRYADILPELDNQSIFEQLDQVYTTGEALHVRNQKLYLVINGKSQPYYFNYSFTPLHNAAGEVYGVMNTAADVTDLNLANQKVEENAKSLRNTILKAPVAMCIFRGADHIVEIANERMIALWGKTAADVLNKPIFVGLPEAKNQGFEQLLDNVLATGEAFSATDVPITLPRNGKLDQVYVNFVYEAYREANGNISGIIAVATDTTDQFVARKKIEEIVAERTKELAEANDSLERSNAELAQFAYIASHDLQEPIRKVSTFAQMLHQSLGDIDERSAGYLAKITTSATRMTTLIRDVLAYSQLSKEQEIFKMIALKDIITDIASDFELLIAQKDATIIYDGLPVVAAIPLQMSQLFGNLISNALKFSRAGVPPVIKITCTVMPAVEVAILPSLDAGISYYNIAFRDNGIGFKQEYASQIFNIFQRLHGKSEYAGTGIGLAMCKKIAQNHHGDIYATGSSENGAVINVILPMPADGTA